MNKIKALKTKIKQSYKFMKLLRKVVGRNCCTDGTNTISFMNLLIYSENISPIHLLRNTLICKLYLHSELVYLFSDLHQYVCR